MKAVRGLACGLVAWCLLIAGCGGGGGSAGPTELPATVTVSTAAPAEVDVATQFGTSLAGPTRGLSFAWSFGDGASSTAEAPAHAYAASGEYTVTLTVTDAAGATRSSQMTVAAGRLSVVQDAVCSGASNSGWCWQRPKPVGNAIADIFFLDGSTGWAVGNAGQILKTTDGGGTWVGQRSGVSTRLTLVRFSDASNGWAIGEAATILRSTDGGATWMPQASGVASSYYGGNATRLIVLSASKAIATFDTYQTRVTSDGGEHWLASAVNPTVATPNGTMWTLASSELSRSTDLGQTVTTSLRTPLYSIYLQVVEFADDLHGLVVGYDFGSYPYVPFLWRTADGGASWQQLQPHGLPDSTYSSSFYVKLTGAGTGWASVGPQLYRTDDAGDSFAPVQLPNNMPYQSSVQQALDANTLWFPYDQGVYLTRDRGATWTLLKVDAENGYSSARFQQTGSTLWLHYGERSYRSVDNGAHWQRVFGADREDQGGSLTAMWFFDGRKGLGYSPAGWVVETSDSGKTWARKALTSQYTYGPADRLQFVSATTGWLATGLYSNSLSKTTDGGVSWWTPLSPPDFGGLADFHFIDNTQGWAVGSSGAISFSNDGGQTWSRQASLPYAFSSVRFASPTVGLVVGNGGIIARTSDGGASWSLRPSGATAGLTRVLFVDTTTAWVVGTNGTVLKSADAGLSWTRVPVASFANFNDVFFIDPQRGWIVGSGGTVLATTDAGRSWQLQASGTDKNLNTAFFIDTRTGWLMGDGGSILATATGGN